MSTKPVAMLWELIGRLANTSLAIRISGEMGVGKEAVARLLGSHYPHNNGSFKKFEFRAQDTDSVPADNSRSNAAASQALEAALAEPANTVFYIRHIESMPIHLQVKLYDTLSGNGHQRPPWVLASSTRSLERNCDNGRFSMRLLDALNTIHISLPALRARPERIPRMLSGILSEIRNERTSVLAAMPGALTLQQLTRYHWPGNWRQLQRVAQNAMKGQPWQAAIDSAEGALTAVADDDPINDMLAVHILSFAKFHIQKERVLDGLMTAASLDEVGLLDLAIFNEAVAQIDNRFSADDDEDDDNPIAGC